jgi:hypothetical protein
VDRLADHQEAHPEEALDLAPVMEKLGIARDLLKSGEYDDALDFAKEAALAVEKMLAPVAPRKPAVKKKKAVAVKRSITMESEKAATSDMSRSNSFSRKPHCRTVASLNVSIRPDMRDLK